MVGKKPHWLLMLMKLAVDGESLKNNLTAREKSFYKFLSNNENNTKNNKTEK